MKKVYTVREYGSFSCGRQLPGYECLPESTFRALEDFILAGRGSAAEPLELMGLSARRGAGRIITAKNYVGVITMKDGTAIEILPKLYSGTEDEGGARARRLLIDMLKELSGAPYKALYTGSVNIERMNILEIFIRMFLDEVFCIVKRGLRCGYEPVEENAAFFKGRPVFSQQIRHNLVHRERCFVTYDEYNANRPENRILKSTLLYLSKRSSSVKNRSDIKTLLGSFAEAEPSADYRADLSKCTPERNMQDYAAALRWCRVFLSGQSFTAFAGSQTAAALLFPMNVLFESYAAAKLKKELSKKGYSVSAQEGRYYLFDEPKKRFLIKPDIVIRKGGEAVCIIDTKWKILSAARPNYGISRADIYQMCAYQRKYSAREAVLLYPKAGAWPGGEGIKFTADDGAVLSVKFIDLLSPQSLSEQLFYDMRPQM